MPTGRALLDPHKILEEAGIRQDMKVADLGVGNIGHFLFPAAEMVGEKGMVFAIDILKSVLDANKSRLKIAGYQNISFIWGDIERLNGTKLPDHSIDLAVMVNVLHAIDKKAAFTEVKRMLGTDGLFLVVEWKLQGGPMGPSPDHRLPKDEAIRLGAAAGLTLKKEFEAGPHHYGLVFTKPRQ